MTNSTDPYAATLERFRGFAQDYDRFRPRPPTALAALLAQFTGYARPELVVDLGSGTGLSSRYWAEQSQQVIGIEPNADMREEAERQTRAPNVRYHEGYSHSTGLSNHCAQIVTCMQSLHWMEPDTTFAEARRILVPGGVFAAVDYDWPPVTTSWRADQAWSACNGQASGLESALPSPRPRRWDKASHRARMKDSGCFRFTRDVVLQHVDEGASERFVGLLRCQGGVMDLIKAGYSEADLGLSELERVARAELGTEPRPFYWSARVRVGVA